MLGVREDIPGTALGFTSPQITPGITDLIRRVNCSYAGALIEKHATVMLFEFPFMSLTFLCFAAGQFSVQYSLSLGFYY